MSHAKRILTIAGSDSSSGAGIQADVKTLAALKCYGLTALTAITAQNTCEVRVVHPLPVAIVVEQIKAVLDDVGADAVKIGMLASAEIARAIAELLPQYSIPVIVLDPVLRSSSGKKLLNDRALPVLKEKLFPISTVITPNIPEAEQLLHTKISNRSQMEQAAQELATSGCEYVLLKGGHLPSEEIIDLLFSNASGGLFTFSSQRVTTMNTHGSGCTLSTAIAAFLAQGFPMPTAVEKARIFTRNAMKYGAAFRIGKGKGPLHQFFEFWESRIE